MKILHTSDWHAGRVWKGISRTDELACVLENLGDVVEREGVDLLLMSGDIFDNGAPSAEAERRVFGFFKRIGRAGVHTIVIAGNHDSPDRVQAWGMLAELVDVRAVARPCPPDRGGVVDVVSKAGERARVAVIPFASVARLVSALELTGNDTQVRQKYADGMRSTVQRLCETFTADTVNLVMAHTHVTGAHYSGSERTVHLGDDWAADPQALPSTAHYVALGHIHKPQCIEHAPCPTHYAGSALQLDFGEAGEEKSAVMVHAAPRQPVRIERIPYQGYKTLRSVRGTLEELEQMADRVRHDGYLRVYVTLERPDADLNSRVRRMMPNTVAVIGELPVVETDTPEVSTAGCTPAELFAMWYRSSRGEAPEGRLVAAFEHLYEESRECAPSA